MNSLRWPRLGISVLLILAVATLLRFLVETRPGFSYFKFFSFFTNQSNILVALFFGAEALGLRLSRSTHDRTRGALVLYMSMTTSIYWLLLFRLVHINDLAANIANSFLHSGALLFLLFDWWRDRPETRMCKRFFVIWLIYPLIYGIGIMIAGKIQSWYPYPFLDIDKLGVGTWALWNGLLVAGIGGLGLLVILLNNRLIKIR